MSIGPMNTVNSHPAEALKRPRWDVDRPILYMTSTGRGAATAPPSLLAPSAATKKFLGLSMADADMAASAIVPPVTVVLEGRSICHRIHLARHASYQSLAAALHRMFVDVEGDDDQAEKENEKEKGETKIDGLDLSNAVPGHIVAYEDMEDDLLLAGDLNWKDFVRVVKRIRIIPAKASRRKHCRGHKCD